jgi:predicted nucleotidyltransferase
MPTLDEEILKATRDLPGIAVLVVFGSRAQGNHRPDSDLDVAVLPDTADSRARRYLQADLAAALAHLTPDGRVDVVLMDEAPEVLRQRIMETGRVLLNRDNEAWKELRVRTMREYGDSEYYRRLYIEAQRRRLERGEPSGRSAKAIDSLKRVGKLPH